METALGSADWLTKILEAFNLNICMLVNHNILTPVHFSLDNNFCKFTFAHKLDSHEKMVMLCMCAILSGHIVTAHISSFSI